MKNSNIKKIVSYILIYIFLFIGGIIKDVYFGTGFKGLNGTISWEDVYKNILDRIIITGIVLLLIYFFSDFLYRKKTEDSSETDTTNK